MAIQQQVPLVPISLLTNHHLLPDESPFRIRPGVVQAVVHEPIATTGLTQDDVPALMQRWAEVVQGAMQKGN